MTLLSELGHVPAEGEHATLLERVALALSSTLELEEVLRRLAVIGLEASGAAGTAVMLLDGRRLTPAVVVRTVMNEGTHERFFAMPPIELDEDQWSLLALGQAVALEDARGTDLVPPELVERFDLRGVAFVPLMAGDEPCGIMSIDWDEVRSFGPRDTAVLEAIGAYAGIAVRNARLFAATQKRARMQEALAEAAATLASPIDPQVVADRLADAYMDLLDIRLCGVALLDPDRRHITAVAARGCTPIPVPYPVAQVAPHIVRRLWKEWEGKKRPVRFDGEAWFDDTLAGAAAGASSYLVLPLVVEAHTRGLVVLGLAPDADLDGEERSVAEALADIAAAALERHQLLADLGTQVHRLEALYQASATLNSSASLDDVLERVCARFEELMGSTHCSVNMIDETGGHLRTLAFCGVPWFAGRTGSVAAIRRAEVARLVERWTADPAPAVRETIDAELVTEPTVVPPEVEAVVLLPLRYNGSVPGVVVIGLPEQGRPDHSRLETAQALANLAAAAVQRARLADALRLRLGQVEALYRLSDVVAGPAEIDAAVDELNRLFADEIGVRFGSISIDNRAIGSLVGARRPDGEEAAALAAWRVAQRSGVPPNRPWAVTGGLLVPLATPAGMLGALRIAAETQSLPPSHEELLMAIGAGCAEVVQRATLRQELAEQERRLAVSGERERIARDLHDSVGQVLTAIGYRLTQYLAEEPGGQWQGRLEELFTLAERGSEQARDAIYSLMFVEARRHGLVPSLRELAAKFRTTTGTAVEVHVKGRRMALGGQKEDALFRVAHEALMNVNRHAAATSVTMRLAYGKRFAHLTVSDDGRGLPPKGPSGADERHFGITAMRQMLDVVGGDLTLRDASAGTGVVVTARVPVGKRRPLEERN